MGGWAYLNAIQNGQWDRFFQKPVRIWVNGFAEQDVMGKVKSFEITAGKWIKGLVAREGEEQRVYVVTIVPELPDSPYERWPYIQSG